MTIHILAIIVVFIALSVTIYLSQTKPDKKLLIARIGSISCLIVLGLYLFSVSQLKERVNYRKLEEVKIFKNEADQEYYFKHQGKVIPMLEACSWQYPKKVPSSRIRSIPEVTVYERTYLPVMGITYGGKKIVYIHGHDARVDQSIELK